MAVDPVPIQCVGMTSAQCISASVTAALGSVPVDQRTNDVISGAVSGAMVSAEQMSLLWCCCYHPDLKGWYPYNQTTGWDTTTPCA